MTWKLLSFHLTVFWIPICQNQFVNANMNRNRHFEGVMLSCCMVEKYKQQKWNKSHPQKSLRFEFLIFFTLRQDSKKPSIFIQKISYFHSIISDKTDENNSLKLPWRQLGLISQTQIIMVENAFYADFSTSLESNKFLNIFYLAFIFAFLVSKQVYSL